MSKAIINTLFSIGVSLISYCFSYSQTFTWTQQGPHAWDEGRAKHATTVISDNKILLFGGLSVGAYEGDLQDTWIYDVNLDSWEFKSPVNSPSARSDHAMAYIGDDKVMLYGGLENNTNHFDDTWIYDLSDNSWTLMNPPSYPSARCNHKLVNIGGDQVLLYGGYHGWGDFNDETWIYDLSDNVWNLRNPSNRPSGRGAYGMSFIGNNQVILFGGAIDVDIDGYAIHDNETWIYNISNNQWNRKSPTIEPTKRIHHNMVYFGGDQSFLFGGFGPDRATGVPLNETWIYDLSADTWIELSLSGSQPTAVLAHTLSPTLINDTRSLAMFLGSRNSSLDDLSIDTWLITWEDPTITFTYTPPTPVNVWCNESTAVENTGGPLTASSTCITGGLTINYSDQVEAGSCENEYTIIRTWTASDDCGISNNFLQTISVSDNVPPSINCGTIPSITTLYVPTENDFIELEDYTDLIVASDNCQGTITIIQNPAQGTSLDVGNHLISFRARDVCGNISNPCNISIVVEVDSSLPSLSLNDYPKYFNQSNSSMEISVEAGSSYSIQRVVCEYKGIAMNDNQIIAREMNYIEGDTYSIEFQNSDFDEQGNEFKIVAYDMVGKNVSSGTKFIYNEYDELSTPKLSNLRYGIEQNKYEIIAIPFQQNISNLSITNLFNDEFGQYGNTRVWRLWTYVNDQIENVEFGNTGFNDSQFRIGKGYWFITKNSVTIDIGPCNTIENNQGDPFYLTLNPGYNQIGNPYDFNVDWSYVVEVNREIIGSDIDLIDDPIKLWKGHWNDISNVIPAKRGAFVYNHGTQSITVEIPMVKNPAPITAKIQENELGHNRSWISENGNEWIISLILELNDQIYKLSGFGMCEEAEIEYDKFDEITPPHFMEYLEIYTLKPEHKWGRITKDVINVQDTGRWDFIIEQNIKYGVLELSWNQNLVKNLNNSLVLYDPADGQSYHMSEIDRLSYDIHDSKKKLRVLYGDIGFINRNMIPDNVIVKDPYPNPFKDNVFIPIQRPDIEMGSQININIYDISGKKINAVFQDKNIGQNSLFQWDGRDKIGHEISSGMYIIHVENKDHELAIKKIFKR